MRRNYWVLLVLSLSAAAANADETNGTAAIGRGIGGAVDAVIGAEIADRNGAMLAALGAPVPSIAIDAPAPEVSAAPDGDYTLVVRPEAKYCAPGLANKGGC